MATLVLTNQEASQSLRGQDVIVTLNSAQSLASLSTLQEGMPVEIDSSGNEGLISFVDYPGNSFKVTPLMPTGNLSSATTPGLLAVGETINVTTS